MPMVISLIQTYGYWAILLGTMLEGETVLLLGGVVAHRGYLELYRVILVAFVGAVIGDQFWFYIGRTRGTAWLASRPKWQATMTRWQDVLSRHQTACTLLFRFLYGFRTVAPLALAMSGMSATRFAILNTVGAVLWALAIAYLGFALGDAAARLLGDVEHYELAAAIVVIAGAALVWIRRLYRRRGGDGGDRV
jgi:membrane protein DedA with SNARE-associated domain